MSNNGLYRTIWRWHFYAGVFVLPFVLCLALTGSMYLFKPQIDRWQERAFQKLDTAHAVSSDQQLAAAMAAYPESRFNTYRLPEKAGDAAMILLGRNDGRQLDVYVSPQGHVLGSIAPDDKFTQALFRLSRHLIGRAGLTRANGAELQDLVQQIAGRIGRLLERRGIVDA